MHGLLDAAGAVAIAGWVAVAFGFVIGLLSVDDDDA